MAEGIIEETFDMLSITWYRSLEIHHFLVKKLEIDFCAGPELFLESFLVALPADLLPLGFAGGEEPESEPGLTVPGATASSLGWAAKAGLGFGGGLGSSSVYSSISE
jgi:hypothetical protein